MAMLPQRHPETAKPTRPAGSPRGTPPRRASDACPMCGKPTATVNATQPSMLPGFPDTHAVTTWCPDCGWDGSSKTTTVPAAS